MVKHLTHGHTVAEGAADLGSLALECACQAGSRLLWKGEYAFLPATYPPQWKQLPVLPLVV